MQKQKIFSNKGLCKAKHDTTTCWLGKVEKVYIKSKCWTPNQRQGPSWPLSYSSWIFNYLCNQCLSSLMLLWVRISIRARCTTLCDKVCQWLATGRSFSPGPPVSSSNKTDCHDITEILLKVALNTIEQINQINANLYSVPRITVFKIQRDQSTTT